MHFMRVGTPGNERPVVVSDGQAFDLSGLSDDLDGGFLETDGIGHAAHLLEHHHLVDLDITSLRIGAPIARPTAVICIGQNYAAHAAESGSPPPDMPIVFFKHPNTVVGAYDDVVASPGVTQLDWEVELGVVIGQRASRLSDDDDPLAYVAGYTIANDVSERNWQRHHSSGQWSKGKSAPTFCPVGPWLVPAADVPDPQALRLWSTVNGEPRQDSNTADMIFGVADLIRHLSHYLTFEPGDLVCTGTPQGVAMGGRFPYLQPGDIVECGIDGLGTMRQTVVAR
jgi:2,4-didehydro-3-deoxy-L-rhamnonate hydrolase